jgi:phosphopantothenoylcysteine decarboxylase/phosphopantothenate--cysteine ligase
MTLQGKKIILAITGSIAAYKTPQLVRLLVKAGATVKVVITESATQFVSPLALSTVSTHEVYSEVSSGSQWNNHVHLSRWAEIVLVAPASANSLAKMAQGICDNMVMAVYLSAPCPIIIAPAMDEDMWLHPATQHNVQALTNRAQHHIIPVEHGALASGIIGAGRMAELENIMLYLTHFFQTDNIPSPYAHLQALITAGPTYEALDPVRFIGNHSTGKMGIAIAKALGDKGVQTTLVLGPTSETCNHPKVTVIRVTSAIEMYEACIEQFPKVDIAIMSAAVADFRPETTASEKIKKKDGDEAMQINLVKNPDILAQLGATKTEHQIVVGFALETNNELENAQKKLIKKQADFIVLNSLQDAGAGFGHDTNKVTLLSKTATPLAMPLQDKNSIAKNIVDCVLTSKQWHEK